MDPERAQRAANNKSLRIIKNELEALAERGFITDAQFDTITAALPAEQSLSVRSPLRTPNLTPQQNNNPYQAPNQNHNSNTIPGLAGMHLHAAHADATPAPPSYQQAQQHVPAPVLASVPQHKEVGHAVALWAYNTPDQRDLNFAAGDHISVLEFVNPEWWMGKNCRTGEEGIFPSNYVRSENYPSPLAQQPAGGYYEDNKSPVANGYPSQQQQAGGYQPYQAPQKQDPYQNHVPPMAMANEGQQQQHGEEGKPNKAEQMGKKFGKKLGNAAIFGAGATIGGNIVNSIF